MKKMIPVLAIVAIAFGMTSCSKSKTCTCKDSAGKTTATYDFKAYTSDQAKAGCNAYDVVQKASSAGGSCSL